MISADDATRLSAVGVVASAFATVVLALITRTLAKSTKALVTATQDEGKLNALANQRSYRLTSHQIDLQSKANVYEDVLTHMYDDFKWIQDKASRIGLSFVPKAYGEKLPKEAKTALSLQTANRMLLHGSPALGKDFESWLDETTSLARILDPHMVSTVDVYGDAQPTQDPEVIAALTSKFTTLFEQLKTNYLNTIFKMREELYPSSSTSDL